MMEQRMWDIHNGLAVQARLLSGMDAVSLVGEVVGDVELLENVNVQGDVGGGWQRGGVVPADSGGGGGGGGGDRVGGGAGAQ